MSCSKSHKMCVAHSSGSSSVSFPAWFDAVRALESLALIAIVLCVAAEIYMDFLSKPSPDRRLVELLALIAGTCGLLGSIIFAVFTPIKGSQNYHYEVYLSWGFGLATASSCFLIAFASVIAYFRRRGLDVASYTASNAVSYRASDGMVVPQGFNSMDLGPPAYNDVVNLPSSGGQGSSGSGPYPADSAHFAYYKPPTPVDAQPPPAYYPPPPSGQFQAPPPYTIVPASAVGSGQLRSEEPAEGESVPVLSAAGDSGSGSGSAQVGLENVAVDCNAPDSALPTGMEGVMGGSHMVSSVSPAVSSVPVYYVTVLGQMVPVFREELQQAGDDAPAPGTTPVPAYFIVTQGQHVPVYSEEQVRAFSNN